MADDELDSDSAIVDEPSQGSRARSRVRTSLGIDPKAAERALAEDAVETETAVPEDFAERMGVDDKAFMRETAVLNVDRLWEDSSPSRDGLRFDLDAAPDADDDSRDSTERWSDPPEPLPEDDLPEESGRFDAKLLAAKSNAQHRHVSAPPASTAAASVSQAPAEAAPKEGRGALIGLGIALLLAAAVMVARFGGSEPNVPASPATTATPPLVEPSPAPIASETPTAMAVPTETAGPTATSSAEAMPSSSAIGAASAALAAPPAALAPRPAAAPKRNAPGKVFVPSGI